MKHKYKLAAEKFNSKPLKSDWIRFAMDLGILESTPDADADAGTISSGLPPDGGVQAASGSNVLHNNDDHNCHGHNSSSRVLGQVVPVQADTSMPAVVSVVEPVTGIDAAALAKFFRRTPGLGKTQIGEYISKGPADIYPFHALVLKEYVKTFDFSGTL